MINWIKYTKGYFAFSLLMIAISIYSLSVWGLKLGVDFTGGSQIEYKFKENISTENVSEKFRDQGIELSGIQSIGDNNYLFKTSPLSAEGKDKIDKVMVGLFGSDKFEEARYETIGPSIGPELVRKTIYATIMAASGILFWVAFQFKSIKFGSSAVLAMIHDSFLLIGFFSIFGHFWGAEVDFLFVTALLTTLSFSVHDTIVVFDRIRELRKGTGQNINEVANEALSETMVRSLNNSFTIIFMLLALILLGGTTVKWFAAALMVGTVFGTYSSPFIAVPLLVVWENRKKH
jgi:preprotein translocase subunit SecF